MVATHTHSGFHSDFSASKSAARCSDVIVRCNQHHWRKQTWCEFTFRHSITSKVDILTQTMRCRTCLIGWPHSHLKLRCFIYTSIFMRVAVLMLATIFRSDAQFYQQGFLRVFWANLFELRLKSV